MKRGNHYRVYIYSVYYAHVTLYPTLFSTVAAVLAQSDMGVLQTTGAAAEATRYPAPKAVVKPARSSEYIRDEVLFVGGEAPVYHHQHRHKSPVAGRSFLRKAGEKHHPFSPVDAPYPLSYSSRVIDL
jgi:hypothetical protein